MEPSWFATVLCFIFLHQDRLTGGVIMFSRCPLVRPSVRSSHLTCDHDILKINEQILMSIDTSGRCGKDMKWSTLWSRSRDQHVVVYSQGTTRILTRTSFCTIVCLSGWRYKKAATLFWFRRKFAIDNLNTKITLPHARKCVNNLIHETFTTQENLYWNQACYGSNNMMKSFIFSCLICLITLEFRSQSWAKLLANQDDNKVSVERSLSVLHN